MSRASWQRLKNKDAKLLHLASSLSYLCVRSIEQSDLIVGPYLTTRHSYQNGVLVSNPGCLTCKYTSLIFAGVAGLPYVCVKA